jgi:hypothetical protein
LSLALPLALLCSADAPEGTTASKPLATEPAPKIPLVRDMRMVIRPTILGLVPHENAEGYGDLFARVLGHGNGVVRVYFEVKELLDKAPRPDAEAPETPLLSGDSRRPELLIRSAEEIAESLEEKGQVLGPDAAPTSDAAPGHAGMVPANVPGRDEILGPEESLDDAPSERPISLIDYGRLAQRTRIRRGELAFSGLLGSSQLTPPLFWDSPFTGDSGAGLWVSQHVLNQLRNNGRSSGGLKLVLGDTSLTSLELEVSNAAARYPVVVNGARTDLPALRCRDSHGLAEYWILDDLDNPLLLKLSFIPPDELLSVGLPQNATELLDEQAAAAARGEELRPEEVAESRSAFGSGSAVPGTGSSAEAEAASTPAATTGLAAPPQIAALPEPLQQLVISGSGYAIVSIDY